MLDNQHAKEEYDYQHKRTSFVALEEVANADITIIELPPARLPDLFAMLGNVTWVILDAISFSLELWSFSFMDLLDNMPLNISEMSTCCHNR